jgi:HK97 family phage prohead protease
MSIDKLEKRFLDSKGLFELRKEAESESRTIAGSAVVYNSQTMIWDGFYEQFRDGAFKKYLEEDIRALWNHDDSIVLGRTSAGTLRLEDSEDALRFEIDLPDTQAGRDAGVSIGRGDVSGVSFGFIPQDVEWTELPDGGLLRTVITSELREISPVTFPAYKQTEVYMRSTKAILEEAKKHIESNKQTFNYELQKRKLELMLIEI